MGGYFLQKYLDVVMPLFVFPRPRDVQSRDDRGCAA